MRRESDRGSAMVLVMVVTALSMIFITTSVALSAANVAPSFRTADRLAALAAAQAGVDALVVELAQPTCGAALPAGCGLFETAARPFGPAGAEDPPSYAWKVLEKRSDFLRVEVTGTVAAEKRTLVADFEATLNPLAYAYFTQLETLSTEVVNAYYGPRTVQFSPFSAARARANLLPLLFFGDVRWAGATGLDICERPWFESLAGPGRSQLRGTRALGVGQDFTERTTAPGPFTSVTRKAPCEVSYGTGFVTTAGTQLYSKDAPLLSRSYSTGTGPLFGAEMLTDWDTALTPAPLPPKWYRSDPALGGDPRSGSAWPAPVPAALALPQPVANHEANATCVFTGPTRITLSVTGTESSARVTSPGTTSLKAGCTAVQDLTYGDSSLVGGLRNAKIVLGSSTVFYVNNASTPVTDASGTNPLFRLSKVGVPVAPVAAGQPATFERELGTTVAALRAAIMAASPSTPLDEVVEAYLAPLNENVDLAAGSPEYQTTGTTVSGTAGPSTVDAVLEQSPTASTTLTRRVCTRFKDHPVHDDKDRCLTWSDLSAQFSIARSAHTFPLTADITRYQTALGTAFVQGTASKPLTIAARDDVVLTGDVKSTGPNITGLIAGDGGVAGADVEIYHPVSCVASTPVTLPGGTCPNDITGLYSTVPLLYPALGFTDSRHPARQYANLRTDLTNVTIQAAVLAHKGCLCVQNYMRGPGPGSTLPPLGTITMKGAVYQAHRGALSMDYGPAVADRSGYLFNLSYDPKVQTAPPPQFATTTTAVGAAAWPLIGVAERQTP